jgi:hypothetical protein
MFKNVNVIFVGAINKAVIAEFKKLSVEEANLLIPTDGFFRYNGDWKVAQIVKEVKIPPIASDGNTLNVHVFLKKVTNNDYYLLH